MFWASDLYRDNMSASNAGDPDINGDYPESSSPRQRPSSPSYPDGPGWENPDVNMNTWGGGGRGGVSKIKSRRICKRKSMKRSNTKRRCRTVKKSNKRIQRIQRIQRNSKINK